VTLLKPDDLLPKSYLSRLLGEFGLEWANLVILVGVLISLFGLDRYLNAGLWAFGAILSFSGVYLVRRSIDGRFLRYFLCAVALIVAAAAGIVLMSIYWGPIGTRFLQHRNVFSFVLSILATVPLAVCIISYRKQEEENLPALPLALQRMVDTSVLKFPFYNRGVEFLVEFDEPAGDAVRVTFEVTLNTVNRTNKVQRLQDIVDPAGSDIEFEYATVDGVHIDADDPDYRSERGFTLVRDMQPRQEIRWTVKASSNFYRRDWEFYGSFFPSTSLSVYVKAPPKGLRLSFISFLPKKIDARQLENGDMVFESHEAVLPFQGLKLVWQPRAPRAGQQRSPQGEAGVASPMGGGLVDRAATGEAGAGGQEGADAVAAEKTKLHLVGEESG